MELAEGHRLEAEPTDRDALFGSEPAGLIEADLLEYRTRWPESKAETGRPLHFNAGLGLGCVFTACAFRRSK
ncbi:MAG: hypothetical protein IPH26_17835 [Sterolibacteriaceae bacterium]|uniref:Uncharacterized protein n=1 Tax=Candidatus Methylophosphatis roskildensis TaxID=2899263 RepID=A0A9D7E6F9_9PROT|nr:hypothetical protein [Candidatus Methylophosphatis roskildensis]MBK7238005.1 hypothetical protein [Sterolibacteriaceae bacterium]